MRGAVEIAVAARYVLGIIPARAGSRTPSHGGRHRCRDHPRACGEQSGRKDATMKDEGSSPRVRGAGVIKSQTLTTIGIIPARAGSSTESLTTVAADWDHPRACGEQAPKQMGVPFWAGSSPRVRGAVVHRGDTRRRPGIIPARAGSRTRKARGIGSSRDHPRACGEQQRLETMAATSQGSSPRVRGAARRRPCRSPRPGIIPARAGSRPICLAWGRCSWDHPRACGEQ